MGALAAAPAFASTGVTVADVSSLRAGATSGTLTGHVYNDTAKATKATVAVRIMRRGTQRRVIGSTTVFAPAKRAVAYRVEVRLPKRLSRGNYYLAACTPSGNGAGKYGCATAEDEVLVKGGVKVPGVAAPKPPAATAAAAEDCSPGARTLAQPGSRLYPETGNGGYKSVHTDVHINYDAPANLFLPGTYVDMTQRSTQCLTQLSVDFERSNAVTSTSTPGPDFTVTEVLLNGRPVPYEFKQPTYPGNPNGPDDPDPAAHAAGNNNPVSATNPNPPACTAAGSGAAAQGVPCPANKLVITPATPIPSGTDYVVTVKYTGRPGVHQDGDGSTEGWFRNNSPVGDGAFVTTEPVGTMAWMPLNNHPTAKPTYDFYDTINYDPAAASNRVAIGNGRLISTTVNEPDANFPGGSRTFHWKSPEPIANYLVENSMGFYSLDERFADSGVIYYEAQADAIAADRKLTNKAVMDTQEDITLFQETMNGQFPFSTNGVIVGIPNAGFEEEMQTKITFAGGRISSGVFHHENMHQWWGDNVSEGTYNLTFLKEGYADMSEGMATARTAAVNAGGLDTPEGQAAFDASLISRFNATYNSTSSSLWTVAPNNPGPTQLFGGNNTYTRPGRSYIALRQILGRDNFASASQEIQRTFGGASITEPEAIAVYQRWLPNQSDACHAKLAEFFKQWWDTAYSGSPAAGNKPQITGPGLAGKGFYDADGGCSDYGVTTVSGTVPATLSLTLGDVPSFGSFAPGVAKTYTTATTATVTSTAGDAALTVSDPGHLTNGAFSLASPLQVALSKSAWTGPASNDQVAIDFSQAIGGDEPLRTGTYSKTVTFTLSTTAP